MTESPIKSSHSRLPRLNAMPTPAKILMTAVIVTLGFGMIGALGQIVIHDIIPTFYPEEAKQIPPQPPAGDKAPASERGDLFAGEPRHPSPVVDKPFYKKDQFVWTLKWTHIHLFGMNMIFILLGAVTLCLDVSPRAKSWLIALPFAGILIDITAMWLKGYISAVFFWLHVPGGLMFGIIFLFVSVQALKEMWFPGTAGHSHRL